MEWFASIVDVTYPENIRVPSSAQSSARTHIMFVAQTIKSKRSKTYGHANDAAKNSMHRKTDQHSVQGSARLQIRPRTKNPRNARYISSCVMSAAPYSQIGVGQNITFVRLDAVLNMRDGIQSNVLLRNKAMKEFVWFAVAHSLRVMGIKALDRFVQKNVDDPKRRLFAESVNPQEGQGSARRLLSLLIYTFFLKEIEAGVGFVAAN